MTLCEKCGLEVPEEDLYKNYGLLVCEDCKIKATYSPSKPCGGEK